MRIHIETVHVTAHQLQSIQLGIALVLGHVFRQSSVLHPLADDAYFAIRRLLHTDHFRNSWVSTQLPPKNNFLVDTLFSLGESSDLRVVMDGQCIPLLEPLSYRRRLL